MKGYIVALVAVVALFGFSTVSSASTLQSMIDYLEKYCDDLSPIDNCGTYDDDASDGRSKSMRIFNILHTYSATQQDKILTGLRKLLANAHARSTGATKFMTAYYYVVFSDVKTDNSKSGSIFDYLFDEDDDSGLYDDDYYGDDDDDDDDTDHEGGEIVRVLSDNSQTRVNDSDDRITIRNNQLALRVLAEDDDGNDGSLKEGFRVVAMFENGKYEGDVYGANYETNGYREFSFSTQFDDADEMTIYLLCKDCSDGDTFDEGDVFEDRTIADEVTYELDFDGDTNNDDDDDYDNDLSIADLEYDYDIMNNTVTVELTTTVRNEGNDTTMLDYLDYTVLRNGSTFSDSNYDITHIETMCDDTSIDEDEDEDIDIDEDDECEITVEFEFDRDDVEDDTLKMEVMIKSNEDDNDDNDEEYISFKVD